MSTLIWLLIFFASFGVLAYRRVNTPIWTGFAVVWMVLFSGVSDTHWLWKGILWLVVIGASVLFNVEGLRKQIITARLLAAYRKVMPSMSRTEKEALDAGTVAYEGEFFTGAPNWQKLLDSPVAELSTEEQAFLDGPVTELCRMIDDWEITHELHDLPKAMWDFLKKEGFFAMIIPKRYGGKEFSAIAHSAVLNKIAARSLTVSSTVAVPNSLGPAELLLHYGTEEQKNQYLPNLASGKDIPCFALTGPDAGSDAASMPDSGIVCRGQYEGKEIVGIKLNFSKRYITLAPIATVIGLAFKLYDPENLLGQDPEPGITCALIPRETPGMQIGDRHFPVNVPFQNGPIFGKDIFIPVDWIIGGAKMAGQGWRMLMECLGAGRAISLPSSASGCAQAATLASGAYARIRKQFNTPVAKFEGVEEVLARMYGNTYIMEAARIFTAGLVDQGERPSVASGIAKYHVTELGRKVANDAMDVQGGKGICMGPNNYLARNYQGVPVSITVEGANILTRNMIIFGQGAMRCHPYVLAELQAAQEEDTETRLYNFDKALFGHVSFTVANVARSVWYALSGSHFAQAPQVSTKRYFQHFTRGSAAFALMTDICMFSLGGSLKRRERISARLGDLLSYLYLGATVLKRYHDQGSPEDSLPLVRYACESLLADYQEAMHQLIQNLPSRALRYLCRFLVFPLGRRFKGPSDKLGHEVVQLLVNPTPARERLAEGMHLLPEANNPVGLMHAALDKIIAAEPVEKFLTEAVKGGRVKGYTFEEQLADAKAQEILTAEQVKQLEEAHALRAELIAVDHFSAKYFSGAKAGNQAGKRSNKKNTEEVS